MATDADIVIRLPVCEARVEQLENVVDTIVKISMSEVPQENQNQDDKHNELPMVKGENFLKSPVTSEVHSEANGVAPDASKVVEPAEESQQNVEVSNNKDGDEDRGVVREEKCSMVSSVAVAPEMKAGDIIDACHIDDAAGVTQLSKETSNDHHGSYDSSTAENVALPKEILLESSLVSKETEPRTPCISQSEKLNLQSESTDDKFTNGKPTKEDLSSNLTLYPEPIENERSVEYDFNTTAEKASHEDISPQETITPLDTSNGDKLMSKSELNTPFSKEEDTVAQKGDKSVTASEDHGVTSKKTLSESHGDVECQSQTLEDVATGLNDLKRVEKFEESSPVQVEDAQIERDDHFEEESERLPLTEVSTEGPAENVALEATDNVKDREDLKEVEVSENEHKGDLAESFHASPENIEVSDLSQEDSVKATPEEQSRNVIPHGDTIKANKATINADDRHEERLEVFPTIILSSHEGVIMNAVLQEDTKVHTYGKVVEEVDNHKEVLENTDQTSKDGLDTLVDRPVELAKNEDASAKETQRSTEESNNTDKYGDIDAVPEVCCADSSVAISEIKVRDTLVDPDMDDAKVVTRISKDTSSDHHGINDSFTEDVALTDEILKKTESHTPCISEGSEDKESNILVTITDNKSVDEKPTEEDISCNLTDEVSKEGESDLNKMIAEQEELENNRSVENITSGETIKTLETSNSDELRSKNEEETIVQKSNEPATTSVDYGVPSDNTSSESHAGVECQDKTLEDAATSHSDIKVTEKSKEISVTPVEDSQIDHNEHLEEEGLPLTEASTWGTNDNVSKDTCEAKEQDEDHEEATFSESEQSTKCTLVTEGAQIENTAESLNVPHENIRVSNISQENNIEFLPDEQSTNAHRHGNKIKAEEATIDAAEGQKNGRECVLWCRKRSKW
ncbi:protein piccolo-like isoform X1 [Salvia splendens]|uniref:protein piccolo-like isoform X1 n=1 Tax=Salvia splendens TaxID=180675 RepID=UPI001C2634F6|nr:protein piccolo-like isoform X1 [Salvia splendens]